MSTPLPFRPFSGEIEKKAFARFNIQQQGVSTMDNEAVAIAWCGTKPKLPLHNRTYLADWKQNQPVKECESREASNDQTLSEINEKITPIYHVQSNNNNDNADRVDSNENFQTKCTRMPAPWVQC
jgi:hypothetical protein